MAVRPPPQYLGDDGAPGPCHPAPMRNHHYYVYLMASKPHGTLYVGMTNDIARRSRQHTEGKGGTFTAKYGIGMLVWYEEHQYVEEAIRREKIIKKWRRIQKVQLIEKGNPHWEDIGKRFR